MSEPHHAFDFLQQPRDDYPFVTALMGDERFLKRLAIHKINHDLQADEAISELDGPEASWRDVRDLLSTGSLFSSGPRVIVINNADPFVSAHRSSLEELAEVPAGTGRLVLDIGNLPANTRLFKILAQSGLIIECRAPQTKRGRSSVVDEPRIRKWIVEWAGAKHQLKIKSTAAEELLQLVGNELGLIDQSLAKLALMVPPETEVTDQQVRDIVGGWRSKTTWDLLDAALEGNGADAILQLDRLLQAGQAPQAICGALLWSLRRFADAAQRIIEAERIGRPMQLSAALEAAGFKKWPQGALQKAERQLRQIGRVRAGGMYGDLLQLDGSLKGSHSSPVRARWALEQFLLSLSKQANPIGRLSGAQAS